MFVGEVWIPGEGGCGMIVSNQAVGFKRGRSVRTYTFSKKEFDPGKVPAYAFELVEGEDEVSFKCEFDGNGIPVMKK